MRVIGGRLKGRGLKSPAAPAIRPTSDRLRETIFNILAHSYGDPLDGAAVLDLFAGTGAMAIEALSRGARSALLVDKSAAACALVKTNVESLGLGAAARILRRDARKLGLALAQERYSLAFLDPPYGKGLAPQALIALRDGSWLDKEALLVVEEQAQADIPLPEGFALIETRLYGDTQVAFVRAG